MAEGMADQRTAEGVADHRMAEGVADHRTADQRTADHRTADQRTADQRTADDPDVAAWRALLVAHSRLVPAFEAELRAAGQVSLSWYDVLLELNSAPERRLRMSELGQRVVLSRTRVSRVVDELTAAGLAERQPDQADGRSSFAALTPQGRAALRRAWPVYREAIRRRLGTQLTPEQCLELASLLEQAARGTQVSLSR